MRRITLALLTCALALCGLGLSAHGVVGLRQARESIGWPSADGEVMWSRIKIVQRMHDERLVHLYGPDVHYRYRVSSRDYESAVHSAAGDLMPEVGRANLLVGRYRSGDAVKVFYDPAQPERAVLVPGAREAALWPVGLGLACLGAALLAAGRLRSGSSRAPSRAFPSEPAPPARTDAADR